MDRAQRKRRRGSGEGKRKENEVGNTKKEERGRWRGGGRDLKQFLKFDVEYCTVVNDWLVVGVIRHCCVKATYSEFKTGMHARARAHTHTHTHTHTHK